MHGAAPCPEHDFSSFRGAGCQSHTPMRRVDHAVRREGDWVIMNIEITFLLHMVRNIAWLHQVGQGATSEYLKDPLWRRDRQQLGVPAPRRDSIWRSVVSDLRFPAPEGVPLIRHR